MTQEEKARAYDEAMNKIKPLYEQAKKDGNPIWSTYEYLIPQLAESEDERMMREFNDWLCEEIECRTNDLRDEKDRRTLNMLCYILTKVKDWLEKQKEQKSAEWKATLNGEPIPTENHSVDISSQEWSGEDNICWDEAFACATRAEKSAKNEEELQSAVIAEKWLKEIQFKYYVHPVKPEWSEEDENMAYFVNQFLEYHENADPTAKSCKKWFNNRLKSLKPSWKPSEEQMKALSWLVKYVAPSEKYIILIKKLYEQLQNLKSGKDDKG